MILVPTAQSLEPSISFGSSGVVLPNDDKHYKRAQARAREEMMPR